MAIKLDDVIKNSYKYKETNSATLYRNKNNIYKIIERNIIFYGEMIKNIKSNYEFHNMVSNNIILPNDLVLYEGHVRGYKCDFVKGKNLDSLASDLNVEEKIIVLNKLTSLLKEINQFLVVGDVNLGNCMYDKNLESFLIDFDLATKIDNPPSWLTLYNFRNKRTKREILSNLNTDKIKMAIISLSILYGIDFEKSFLFRKPYTNFDMLCENTTINYINEYFDNAFLCLYNNENINDYFFVPDSHGFVDDLYKDIALIKTRVK